MKNSFIHLVLFQMCHDILQMAMDFIVCVWSRQCFQMSHISANKDVSIILCSCIYNNSEMCCSQFIDNENNIRVTRTPNILYNTNDISYNENTTYYSIVEIYPKNYVEQ